MLYLNFEMSMSRESCLNKAVDFVSNPYKERTQELKENGGSLSFGYNAYGGQS